MKTKKILDYSIILFILLNLISIKTFACIFDTCKETTPQYLKEFEQGCYGLENEQIDILVDEGSIDIGYLYLQKKTTNNEIVPYNLLLCKEKKNEVNGFFKLDKYFSNEELKYIFENNNIFTIKQLSDNWILSIKNTNGIPFLREEVRYNLGSIIVSTKNNEVIKPINLKTTLTIAVKQITNNYQPKWKNPISFYNKNCSLSDSNSYCVLQGEHHIYEEEILEYTFKSEDIDPLDNKERKTEYEFDNVFIGEDKEIYNFEDIFYFDKNTNTLYEKDKGSLKLSLSPYSLKVTVRELKLNNEDSDSTSSLQNFTINILEKNEVSNNTKVTTIRDSNGSNNNGGYKLINTSFKQTNSPSPKVEISNKNEDIFICPKKKYKRYPDLRKTWNNDSLFKDAYILDKSYTSLIDLAEQKIVNGDNNGYARLSDFISRAEFVKIMTIAREDTLLLGDCLKFSNFLDIPNDAWFTPFVQNLEQKAIVKGYTDNRYRPEQSINLAEAYKIIALSFDYISLHKAHTMVHENEIEWYEPYFKALKKEKVIPSWMDYYPIESHLSRGDMFVLLSNVLKQKDKLPDYTLVR
jgi:hypothetical protein